ncbi:Para-aminobenzoate synthase [Tetrabaena socialis]|uniref:aminodeoxychorismate synthase n=1 Tax=Tetrabaena socialis TaxID=47790 RepID=A0A2J7ZWF2_9CHLO|nr:Para-aminobenzoate synthase [Tetrabaena socialis]|eukprot:PNH04621.1 Para-aminobenzoate synthase [Tetrabaena socialis]
MRTLLIDNYDSYTYNLYQVIADVNGELPLVFYNDEITLEQISAMVLAGTVHSIVISPGPGTPRNPHDIGVCLEVLQQLHDVPILGICLGHQALALAHGASVVAAPEPVHGRLSQLRHSGHELFRDIPSEGGFQVVRYHSLLVDERTLPACLEAVCWTAGGHAAVKLARDAAAAPAQQAEHAAQPPQAASSPGGGPEQQQQQQQLGPASGSLLMGLAHRTRPHYGVQFHPESVATRYGVALMRNFRDLAAAHLQRRSGGAAVELPPSRHVADLVGPPVRLPPLAPWPSPSHQRGAPLRLSWVRLGGMLGRLGGSQAIFELLHGWALDTFWLDSAATDRGRFSYMGGRGGPLWRKITYKLPPPPHPQAQQQDQQEQQQQQQQPQGGGAEHGVGFEPLPLPCTAPGAAPSGAEHAPSCCGGDSQAQGLGSQGRVPQYDATASRQREAPPSRGASSDADSDAASSSSACGGSDAQAEAAGPGPGSSSGASAATGSSSSSTPRSASHPPPPPARGGTLVLESADGTTAHHAAPGGLLDYLQQLLARQRLLVEPEAAAALPFNFWGGLVGYLGYELKAECGAANAHASAAPDAVLYLADRLVAVDHAAGDVFLLELYDSRTAAAAVAEVEQGGGVGRGGEVGAGGGSRSSSGGRGAAEAEVEQGGCSGGGAGAGAGPGAPAAGMGHEAWVPSWLRETQARLEAAAAEAAAGGGRGAASAGGGSSGLGPSSQPALGTADGAMVAPCEAQPGGTGEARDCGHAHCGGPQQQHAAPGQAASVGPLHPVHAAPTAAAATVASSPTSCGSLDASTVAQPHPAAPPTAQAPAPAGVVVPFTLEHSREAYLRNVAACQAALHAGESYEVCLTTALTRPAAPDPAALYRSLRRLNPAPYAAWLQCGAAGPTICCSSPERFLRGDRGGLLEARPIKGTAARVAGNPAADAAAAAELAASEKERAENLMIVDLLRNDLGRVCEVGSVHVPGLMDIESYATVHQMVSTVRGVRRAGTSAMDCIRAAFPGGSMTGAPKVRTMRIIDTLEGRARGVYSGCIGFISLNDTFDLNIVIRTAVIEGEGQGPAVSQGGAGAAGAAAAASPCRMSIGAGGAIVVQSEPEAEYEEMRLKASALLRAVGLCEGGSGPVPVVSG